MMTHMTILKPFWPKSLDTIELESTLDALQAIEIPEDLDLLSHFALLESNVLRYYRTTLDLSKNKPEGTVGWRRDVRVSPKPLTEFAQNSWVGMVLNGILNICRLSDVDWDGEAKTFWLRHIPKDYRKLDWFQATYPKVKKEPPEAKIGEMPKSTAEIALEASIDNSQEPLELW